MFTRTEAIGPWRRRATTIAIPVPAFKPAFLALFGTLQKLQSVSRGVLTRRVGVNGNRVDWPLLLLQLLEIFRDSLTKMDDDILLLLLVLEDLKHLFGI